MIPAEPKIGQWITGDAKAVLAALGELGIVTKEDIGLDHSIGGVFEEYIDLFVETVNEFYGGKI